MDQVSITYYGHACFGLGYRGYTVILDPYADGKIPGLDDLKVSADAVYCSHSHDDHGYAAAVTLSDVVKAEPFTLETLTVPHDDKDGALRGMNTVHIFNFDGLRVAHLGDIGRQLTADEAAALADLDCLLVPVGGFYTVDAAQAADMVGQLHPRVTVPMHYRHVADGWPQITPVQAFTNRFSAVEYAAEDTLLLTRQTKQQILVLRARNSKE